MGHTSYRFSYSFSYSFSGQGGGRVSLFFHRLQWGDISTNRGMHQHFHLNVYPSVSRPGWLYQSRYFAFLSKSGVFSFSTASVPTVFRVKSVDFGGELALHGCVRGDSTDRLSKPGNTCTIPMFQKGAWRRWNACITERRLCDVSVCRLGTGDECRLNPQPSTGDERCM